MRTLRTLGQLELRDGDALRLVGRDLVIQGDALLDAHITRASRA